MLHAVIGKGAMNKITYPVTNGAMTFKLKMLFLAVRTGAMNALMEPGPLDISHWQFLWREYFLLRNTPRFYYSYGAVIVTFTVGKCVPDGQQLY